MTDIDMALGLDDNNTFNNFQTGIGSMGHFAMSEEE